MAWTSTAARVSACAAGVSLPTMSPRRALIVAPLVAVLAVNFIVALFQIGTINIFTFILSYTLVGGVLGIISAFIFAPIIQRLFSHWNLRQLWQYAFGGVTCTLPFWVLWFYPFNGGHWESFQVSNTLYFLSIGALAGGVFWWITIKSH